MDQIEIEGGHRSPVQDSSNAADNNELHPVSGKSYEYCLKIKSGMSHLLVF